MYPPVPNLQPHNDSPLMGLVQEFKLLRQQASSSKTTTTTTTRTTRTAPSHCICPASELSSTSHILVLRPRTNTGKRGMLKNTSPSLAEFFGLWWCGGSRRRFYVRHQYCGRRRRRRRGHSILSVPSAQSSPKAKAKAAIKRTSTHARENVRKRELTRESGVSQARHQNRKNGKRNASTE